LLTVVIRADGGAVGVADCDASAVAAGEALGVAPAC
jgi:hypothetical protein